MQEGQRHHPPAAAPFPRSVGGYEIVRTLGSGGMGTVYEAIDADGRSVALKRLHPALLADDEARSRLRREVATLHRVRGEHVARVLDAEADADEAFVVTELIDGQTLEDSVREHGPMDALELADLAEGLARAMSAIHGVGVVHRDLKPGNVMLTDDGPVVIDFGISQLADDARLTRTGLVTGTPGYVDPQVLGGGGPGVVGDWWGWAAVLLFAATGRPPFGTGPLAGVLARVETGRADVAGLPPRIAQVLRRALHPDPERRLRPEGVRQALADVAAGREPTVLLASEAGADPSAAGPLPPVIAPGGSDGTATGARAGRPVPATDRPGGEVARTSVMPAQPDGAAPAVRRAEQAPVAAQGYHPEHDGARPLDPAQPGQAWPAVPWQPGAGEGWAGHGGQQVGAEETPEWARPARSRPAVTAAWWFGVVGAGALWPWWTLMAVTAVLVVGGTVGSAGRALRQRRLRRGVRRSDVAMTSLATPAHLLLAVLLVVPGAAVGALGGGIVWALAAPSATVRPEAMVLVTALVVAVITQLVWWTPSSRTARQGVWAALRSVAPTRGTGAIWVTLGLLVAVVTGAAILLGSPSVVWAPFGEPWIPSFLT